MCLLKPVCPSAYSKWVHKLHGRDANLRKPQGSFVSHQHATMSIHVNQWTYARVSVESVESKTPSRRHSFPYVLGSVWWIHVTKWLSARSLLFLAPHQVGFFLEYLNLYPMEFVQIKRRVRGKSSSFWWGKRYSAVWSDSREHSENYFRQNPCTLSR